MPGELNSNDNSGLKKILSMADRGLLSASAGICLLLLVSFFLTHGFFSNKKSAIIRSDGFGYYSYLPAIFIYNDYTQEFVKKKFPKHYDGSGVPEYMEKVNGKPVDKYFFGTAVMM